MLMLTLQIFSFEHFLFIRKLGGFISKFNCICIIYMHVCIDKHCQFLIYSVPVHHNNLCISVSLSVICFIIYDPTLYVYFQHFSKCFVDVYGLYKLSGVLNTFCIVIYRGRIRAKIYTGEVCMIEARPGVVCFRCHLPFSSSGFSFCA